MKTRWILFWATTLFEWLLGCSQHSGIHEESAHSSDSPATAVSPVEQQPVAGEPAKTPRQKQFFQATNPLPKEVSVKPSLSLPKVFDWYGIDAVATGSQGNDATAARDDNLLTAWQCDMKADEPCLYELKMKQPATVCAVRLFATAPSSSKAAKAQGYTRTVKLHTDEGVATVMLQRRFNYQTIVFPECVTTKAVTLEAVDFYLTPKTPTMVIAEVELLGIAGAKRAPIQLRDETAVTVTEGPFWVRKNKSCVDCVYQGSAAAPAWIELVDGRGGRQRLLQGHSVVMTKSKKWMLVSKTIDEYCPGASSYKVTRHYLVDTVNRTMYSIKFKDTPTDHSAFQISKVFRHDEEDAFAVKCWSVVSGGDERLVTLQMTGERPEMKLTQLSELSYEEMDKEIRKMGFEAPNVVSIPSRVDIPKSERLKWCREFFKKAGAQTDASQCEEIVNDHEWYRMGIADGKTLVVATPDICMSFETETSGFALVLDKDGQILHSMGGVDYIEFQVRKDGRPLLEVFHFGVLTAKNPNESDIYIVNDKGQIVRAYPGAAFYLPASPGCLCEA